MYLSMRFFGLATCPAGGMFVQNSFLRLVSGSVLDVSEICVYVEKPFACLL